MTQHYFTSNPQSAHDERAIQVELAGVRADFCTDAGVFSRDGLDFGSRLLIETVHPLLHGRVLDMGCGWGAIGSAAGQAVPGRADHHGGYQRARRGVGGAQRAAKWR